MMCDVYSTVANHQEEGTTELKSTAVISRVLDRFLFPSETNAAEGGCFHQFVSRIDSNYTSDVVLTADFKHDLKFCKLYISMKPDPADIEFLQLVEIIIM